MSSSFVHLATSRTPQIRLGLQCATAARIQPVAAIGCKVAGSYQQCRSAHRYFKAGHTTRQRNWIVNNSKFTVKLPRYLENAQTGDVKKALKRLDKEDYQKAVDENRFLPRNADDALPLKPLAEGEVGLVDPAARADFLLDHTVLDERLKRRILVKDSPTLAKLHNTQIKCTGYDKIMLEKFMKDVRRFLSMCGTRKSAILGLPETSKEYRVLKNRITGKKETKVVSFELVTYTRLIQLQNFPGFYTDMLIMMMKKYVPAGIDISLESHQSGALGAAYANKDMRATAAKMARKAVKQGKSNVKYIG